MTKSKIALFVLVFVLATMVVPLILLLAFVDANSISVYIVVYGGTDYFTPEPSGL